MPNTRSAGSPARSAPAAWPPGHVVAQQVEHRQAERALGDPRQVVALERRPQHQPLEIGVAAVVLEDLQRQLQDEGLVVLLGHRAPEHLERAVDPLLPRLVIQDGGVEVFLRREVPEDDAFADTGRLGDRLGGRAAEAVGREQMERRLDQLLAPLVAAHPAPGERPPGEAAPARHGHGHGIGHGEVSMKVSEHSLY